MDIRLEKERLFFQSYQILEKELLEITDYIHFTDENLNVFSIKFSNFIIRANVECESLLKELYKRTADFKDKDEKEKNEALEHSTFKQVNEVYHLDKKNIYLSSEIFYFKNKYNKPFIPCNFEKNEKDMRKIYNALKHDKVNNLIKADLETAINILGFLFVLNICFYPELIYKNQEERSRIFRGQKAYIEPLILSMFSELDRLKINEVEEYLDGCLYYERLTSKLEDEDIPFYLITEFEHMCNDHKKDINRSIVELVREKNEYGKLYKCSKYPFLMEFPKLFVNDGCSLELFHKNAKEVLNLQNINLN